MYSEVKCMNKIAKIILSALAVVIVLSASAFLALHNIHYDIIDGTPYTADWILENGMYKVVPVITEYDVTFYVEDYNGNLIYEPNQHWRDWDFKSLNIDENNVITAHSADMGIYVYKEDGNGFFYLAEPIFDE